MIGLGCNNQRLRDSPKNIGDIVLEAIGDEVSEAKPHATPRGDNVNSDSDPVKESEDLGDVGGLFDIVECLN
jgi:hypothetical protein